MKQQQRNVTQWLIVRQWPWLPTKKQNQGLVATTSNTYTLDALVHVHELLHAS